MPGSGQTSPSRAMTALLCANLRRPCTRSTSFTDFQSSACSQCSASRLCRRWRSVGSLR